MVGEAATGKAQPGMPSTLGPKLLSRSRAAHEEGRRLANAAPLPSPGPTASSHRLRVRGIDLLWWMKGIVDVLARRVADWPITRRRLAVMGLGERVIRWRTGISTQKSWPHGTAGHPQFSTRAQW